MARRRDEARQGDIDRLRLERKLLAQATASAIGGHCARGPAELRAIRPGLFALPSLETCEGLTALAGGLDVKLKR